MKSIITVILVILLNISGGTTLFASHAGMMELTYRHISSNTYEFTLIFYRNCLGATATAPSTISLRAESQSLSVNVFNAATLIQVSASVPNAPKTRPDNFLNCTNMQTCWEEYVYRGTMNLNNLVTTPYANDWVFSYQLCCYPTGAATPDNVTAGTIYTECGLNNQDFPGGNDAPFWHERWPIRPGYTTDTTINYPGLAICEGVLNTIDQSVKEYEGDQIKYEFIEPLTAGGVPLGYINGFSLTTPMPFITPPGLEIDSTTGLFDLEGANSPYNVFILGIRANEYRMDTVVINGVFVPVSKKIGHVYRNLMVILEPATTCPDKSIELKKNKLNVSCADTVLNIETTKKFKCHTADFDGSFVILKESTTGNVVPIDSVVVNSCFADFVAKRFNVYLNAPFQAGEYYLTLKNGGDGNTVLSECGSEIAPFSDTVFITVDTIDVAEIVASQIAGQSPVITAECGQTELGIKLNYPVRCNSIDLNGSEFVLIDSSTVPPSVKAISTLNRTQCSKGYTDTFELVFTTPLEGGVYQLNLIKGTDGNTFLNECRDETAINSYRLIVPEVEVDLGPDLTYCKDSIFYAVIGPSSGFATYNWSTGQKDPQIVVTKAGVYSLEAENNFGCKALDTVIVTEIDCGTGIEQLNIPGIQIIPNPVVNQLNIIRKAEGSVVNRIQILSIEGKMVMNKDIVNDDGTSQLNIAVDELPNGIYFLRLTNFEGGQHTFRFVVNR